MCLLHDIARVKNDILKLFSQPLEIHIFRNKQSFVFNKFQYAISG